MCSMRNSYQYALIVVFHQNTHFSPNCAFGFVSPLSGIQCGFLLTPVDRHVSHDTQLIGLVRNVSFGALWIEN
jgi:hypothetical protein